MKEETVNIINEIENKTKIIIIIISFTLLDEQTYTDLSATRIHWAR